MTNNRQGWTRRDLASGLALFGLAVGVPATVVSMTDLAPDAMPTERQRAMLRDVAQVVLPATGTPGAGDVAVADFVILALAHGLDGARKPLAITAETRDLPRRVDGSLRYHEWLERELDSRANGDFMARSPAVRHAALAALDAAAYPQNAPPPDPAPWRTVKSLILMGYYTSEIGASRELRFELVPGRWDPDLPLQPGGRAWSSDWTAVDFG